MDVVRGRGEIKINMTSWQAEALKAKAFRHFAVDAINKVFLISREMVKSFYGYFRRLNWNWCKVEDFQNNYVIVKSIALESDMAVIVGLSWNYVTFPNGVRDSYHVKCHFKHSNAG